MFDFSNAEGFPCPKCNPDNSDPDQNKRIRTTLQALISRRDVECHFCGFRLKLIQCDENEHIINAAKRFETEIGNIQHSYDSGFKTKRP